MLHFYWEVGISDFPVVNFVQMLTSCKIHLVDAEGHIISDARVFQVSQTSDTLAQVTRLGLIRPQAVSQQLLPTNQTASYIDTLCFFFCVFSYRSAPFFLTFLVRPTNMYTLLSNHPAHPRQPSAEQGFTVNWRVVALDDVDGLWHVVALDGVALGYGASDSAHLQALLCSC